MAGRPEIDNNLAVSGAAFRAFLPFLARLLENEVENENVKHATSNCPLLSRATSYQTLL